MRSKERVLGAFAGRSFDRLPMWYGAEPGTTANTMKYLNASSEEELMRKLSIDLRTVRPRYIGPELRRWEDGRFETYWGLVRGGGFWGIALNAPLEKADTVADIDRLYTFPKTEWFDVAFTAEDKKLADEYCIIGGMWSPFWHETQELFGLERMFEKLYDNPSLVEAVIERVVDFNYVISREAFEANKGLIDIFWFANDFGTQHNLIMNPEMWRKFFKPGTRKLAELGHQYGLKVAMHSCGDVHEIIPDLIEVGIEILNPIQPTAKHMDPAQLKKEYGNDLIFFGAIDVTEILNHGSAEDVRQETRRIIDILGYDGRYIIAPSHDLMMEEIPPENIVSMYDEGRKYSTRYSKTG